MMRERRWCKGIITMDNEILITTLFLGPSFTRCEVEKIAAGQTRRGWPWRMKFS